MLKIEEKIIKLFSVGLLFFDHISGLITVYNYYYPGAVG